MEPGGRPAAGSAAQHCGWGAQQAELSIVTPHLGDLQTLRAALGSFVASMSTAAKLALALQVRTAESGPGCPGLSGRCSPCA